MGGIMIICWGLRFFVFHLYESPKFLVGRGRDEEAVEVIHKVAAYNGVKSSLRLEHLQAVDREHGAQNAVDTSVAAAAKRTLEMFDTSRVKALFVTRKMAYSTSLLIVLWGTYILIFTHTIGE
jgi:hypothetical protein